MKWFVLVVLAWFLIAALVVPEYLDLDFDVWTTPKYDDIMTVLKAPVDVLSTCVEFASSAVGSWLSVFGQNDEGDLPTWTTIVGGVPVMIYNWLNGLGN